MTVTSGLVSSGSSSSSAARGECGQVRQGRGEDHHEGVHGVGGQQHAHGVGIIGRHGPVRQLQRTALHRRAGRQRGQQILDHVDPSSAGARPSTCAVSSARRAGLTAWRRPSRGCPAAVAGRRARGRCRRAGRTVCTRITPACSYSAAVVGSPAAPARTATIGLCCEIRRAIRANLRGLPKRFEVHAGSPRSRSSLPVLEEVVAADVGLVADGYERRDPDLTLFLLAR